QRRARAASRRGRAAISLAPARTAAEPHVDDLVRRQLAGRVEQNEERPLGESPGGDRRARVTRFAGTSRKRPAYAGLFAFVAERCSAQQRTAGILAALRRRDGGGPFSPRARSLRRGAPFPTWFASSSSATPRIRACLRARREAA